MREFTTAEFDTARAQSEAHRAAEDAARAHRLDLDRVIDAALSALNVRAYDAGGDAKQRNHWLSGYVFGSVESHRDVLSLIDEIRAGLSPLVR